MRSPSFPVAMDRELLEVDLPAFLRYPRPVVEKPGAAMDAAGGGMGSRDRSKKGGNFRGEPST